jgi:FSR family fosmidomycin resistance protein-like MFS transporter
MATAATVPSHPQTSPAESTVLKVLIALSFSHLLNDMMQSLIPALYPLLKASFRLNFTQIGLITLAFQFTASLLQPLVGYYTDLKPRPYSLPIGMGITLVGLVMLSLAGSYHHVLVGAALIGTGSAIFHPEASRVAKMASGGRHGFAQSLFQVGGNFGSSLGPLLAAAIVVPHGQRNVLWFSLAALLGMVVLSRVGGWYKRTLIRLNSRPRMAAVSGHPELSPRRVRWTVGLLMALIFSKFFYMVSLTSYYTFFLIGKFHLSVQSAQICLFVFLFSVAAGTILGGPLGDRFGRRIVIWVSILGVAPFTLILPHVDLAWTIGLSVVIGLVLASAFPAIVVYAHELVPGMIGTVTGLMLGFAFGVAAIGSAVLGALADHTSINFVYGICGFLPLIGLLAFFLPNIKSPRAQAAG